MAATAPAVVVPEVVGYASPAGALPWVACTRLPGSIPDPGLDAPDLDAQIGRVAARLHALATPHLDPLLAFGRNIRVPEEIAAATHLACRELAAALAAVSANVADGCVPGFVHGDFSRHNVLIGGGVVQGVIDFERCGFGCIYEDLATLRLHDVLLGASREEVLLDAYTNEWSLLRSEAATVRRAHLAWHTAHYAAWILQWAFDVDQSLAEQVVALVPSLAAELATGESGDHP